MAPSPRHNESAAASIRRQEFVADLGRRAFETDDVDRVLGEATEEVGDLLEAESVIALESAPEDDRVTIRGGYGIDDELVGTHVDADAHTTAHGAALVASEPVVVDDVGDGERYDEPAFLRNREVGSAVWVAIESAAGPWGALGAHTERTGAFDRADGTFLRTVANVIGSVVDRTRVRRRRTTEATLSEKLVEASPIGITIVDTDGGVRFANDRAEEILGRTHDRIDELRFDEPVWDEVGPDGEPLERSELPYTRILETGEPVFDRITGVRRPNGRRVWLSINGAPLPDDGSVDGVVFAIEEITDRFERALELERYETVVETAHEGIYVLDSDRRFELVNDAFADLTPFSRAELAGRHASTVFGDAFASTEAEKWRVSSEDEPPTFEETIDAGPNETRTIENRFVISDIGAEEKRIGVVRDVTERNERERKLGKYRTIIEAVDDGIYSVDEDDRFTVVNRAYTELTGYDREELLDEHVSIVVDDDGLERARALAAEEGTRKLETGLETADGDLVPVEATVTMHAQGTDEARRIGVVRDVTERNEYRRKLEASNERLEQFAYAASHDLQEPLRMVSSYLQLLDHRYGDDLDADATEFISFAVDGAERMSRMIDGLLAYSRVDTQGDPFEPVDLEVLLEEVLEDLCVRIEETDAEITSTALPTVSGDPSQLRRVLQNLVSNALTYSGAEAPTVAIEATCRDRRCVVSVRDEGIGIDPDDQERIFEIFSRLHTSEEHQGAGIGLALARRIVERHGGHIWVESGPGEGAAFSFTLSPASADVD